MLVMVFFCGAALARSAAMPAARQPVLSIFGRGGVKGCPEQLVQWALPPPLDNIDTYGR